MISANRIRYFDLREGERPILTFSHMELPNPVGVASHLLKYSNFFSNLKENNCFNAFKNDFFLNGGWELVNKQYFYFPL